MTGKIIRAMPSLLLDFTSNFHFSRRYLAGPINNPPSKMNERCTEDKSSALSSDELDDLLKQCHTISIPVDEALAIESPPSAAGKDKAPISDRDVIVVPNLAGLDKLPQESIDNDRLFVAVNRECILHESKSIPIKRNDNHCHYFYIENMNSKPIPLAEGTPSLSFKLKSLCVSIVFSGVFDGPDYQAGSINVSLRRLSNDREPIAPLPMGVEKFRSQNSIDSIGLITIDHELESKVIESGLIELTITAEAASSYTIGISGTSFARRVDMEVKRQAAELQEKQGRIDNCKSKHHSLFFLQQLLERKIKVVDELHAKDRVSLDKCKEEVDQLEDELDESNGTEDEDTLLLRKIKALSIEHKHFLSRNRYKEDVRKDLSSKLEDVKREIANILKDGERLVKETGEGKAILSAAYIRLGLLEV
jgi:hypothetical protein